MSLLDDVEPLYEADAPPWGPGPVCRLHIPGHVDDDTATAVAWAWLYDQELDERIDRPQRLWTNHIDDEGGERVVYSTVRREGWAPVTRVDLDPVPYRPCTYCAWHATTGIPEAGGHAWVCDGHAAEMRGLRVEEVAESSAPRDPRGVLNPVLHLVGPTR